ncbi:MAG: hypothetical protein V4525_14730 [Pseudomonadota bacterium]
MIPSLPQNKTYFSLDEVCQWVDVTPEALQYWITAQNSGFSKALTIHRRYHRRELLWLCKVKPAIDAMTNNLAGPSLDLSPVKEELQSLLESLGSTKKPNTQQHSSL